MKNCCKKHVDTLFKHVSFLLLSLSVSLSLSLSLFLSLLHPASLPLHSNTTALSTVPLHPRMVSCAGMAIDHTSLILLVINQALCQWKSPLVSAIAAASRAGDPMVVTSHHMVSSKADQNQAGEIMVDKVR